MAENRRTDGLLPTHIGIIMDGNGRWAQKRGLPRSAGHKQGARVFRNIVRYCREIGIGYLTVYAFSTENWKRPQSEIDAIMDLLRDYLDELERHGDEQQGVLRFIGDMEPLAEDLRLRIAEVQERTAGREGIVVNIALNYGGRAEIVHAVQQAVRLSRQGSLAEEAVDEALVDSLMYTVGQPPVDLDRAPQRGAADLPTSCSGREPMRNLSLWMCFGRISHQAIWIGPLQNFSSAAGVLEGFHLEAENHHSLCRPMRAGCGAG